MDSVLSCMVTDNLGPGTLSDKFVQLLREHLQCAGGIVLRERSRALAVALAHLELEDGSAVAVDALSPWYFDTVIRECGLRPLYVDVAEEEPVIDTVALSAVAGQGTATDGTPAAVIVAPHHGYLPELAAIADLGLPVVEDVTEGIGSHDGTDAAGSIGRFVLVGLEADGMITAGGGAALLGRSRTDRNALRHEQDQLPPDALLSDMNSALGITQVRDLEKYIARRAEIAEAYRRAAMRGRHKVVSPAGDGENGWPGFPVMIEGSVAEVVAYARKKGVEVAPAFPHSAIARSVCDEAQYPNARTALLRCVIFPLYPSLSAKEVATVERVIATLP